MKPLVCTSNDSIADSKAQSRALEAARGGKFTLDSLLLVMTMICIGMGIVAALPRLTLPLALAETLAGTLALCRTIAMAARRRKDGRPLTVGDKIAHFCVSVLFVGLNAFAAMVVWLVMITAMTCFDPESSVAGIVSNMTALAAFVFLMWIERPTPYEEGMGNW